MSKEKHAIFTSAVEKFLDGGFKSLSAVERTVAEQDMETFCRTAVQLTLLGMRATL